MKVGLFLILVTLGVVLFLFFGSNNEGLVFLSAKKDKDVKPDNAADCKALRPGNQFINGICYAANNIPPAQVACNPSDSYIVQGVCYKNGTVITPGSKGCPKGFEDKDGRGRCTVMGPTLNTYNCPPGQLQTNGTCGGPPQVPAAASVQPVVTSVGFGGAGNQPTVCKAGQIVDKNTGKCVPKPPAGAGNKPPVAGNKPTVCKAGQIVDKNTGKCVASPKPVKAR